MSRLKDQFLNSPVLYDLRRGIQKASPRNWQPIQAVVIVLVALGLMLLAYSFFVNVSLVDATVPTAVILPILSLVIPTILHATFAGEWQARSLNSLMVAPLTTQQLVVAKVLRALLPFVLITALLILVTFGAQGIQELMQFNGAIEEPVRTWRDVLILAPMAVLASLTYTLMLVGVTALVSSYCKTTSAALLGTLGVLIIGLLILPIVVGVFEGNSQILAIAHPFGQLPTLSASLDDTGFQSFLPFRETWMSFFGTWLVWAVIGCGALVATHARMSSLRQSGIED